VTKVGRRFAEIMAENKDSKTCYNVDTKHSKYVFVGDNITINVYPQKGITVWFS
jgi:hypothetical protein